jgi:hypothetical protein
MLERKRSISSLAFIASASLVVGLVGCVSDETVGTQAPSGTAASEEKYTAEVTRLKQNVMPQYYDEALVKLQEEYGVKRQIVLPENKLRDGLVKQEIKKEAGSNSSAGALPKTAGTIFTGTYTPAVLYTNSIYLSAGDVVEFSTSGGPATVDPVLVLFDITNQASDFLATGVINAGQNRGLTYVYTYNDDFSGMGRHAKITYTATASGYHGVQCYPYSSSSTGSVTLTQKVYHAGAWTTTNTAITVAGAIFSYSGASYTPSYFKTQNLQNGADPWLWMWSYSWNGGMGAENDDALGGGIGNNSDLANTAVFPQSRNDNINNCVLMGAYPYAPGGTATWVFWN